MSFRRRLFLAFLFVALVPVAVVAFGVRREMDERVTTQYEHRVAGSIAAVRAELARQDRMLADRLTELGEALQADNRFRLAVLSGDRAEREYLLDYAARVMRLTGLQMLQIQDEHGRILSSGHFRNEYDRLAPELPRSLERAGMALIEVRAPHGSFLAFGRTDSVPIGGRRFDLVGGVLADRDALLRLAGGGDIVILLDYPGGRVASRPDPPAPDDLITDAIEVPFRGLTGGREPRSARLVVGRPLAPLRALRAAVDRWFYLALFLGGTVAVLLAGWLSGRVSRPLHQLARKTALLDLDHLDVEFEGDRKDEIGVLSRTLQAMTGRLRASLAAARESERRAVLGDLARQVNHDIKNGLIPIRNALRHLSRIAADAPDDLAHTFRDRQDTLRSSVEYLEKLAGNYGRLSPRPAARECDVNRIVAAVVSEVDGSRDAAVRARLDEGLPGLTADPVALRRVLENLIANAIEALDGGRGTVEVRTGRTEGGSEGPGVRIVVEDTGRGLSPEERSRIFEDFYTTRPDGTGLGLSIVRRLVTDLDGRVRVESEEGVGTRVTVELPVRRATDREPADASAPVEGGEPS